MSQRKKAGTAGAGLSFGGAWAARALRGLPLHGYGSSECRLRDLAQNDDYLVGPTTRRAEFADEIDGAGGDDEAVRGRDAAGLGEGFGDGVARCGRGRRGRGRRRVRSSSEAARGLLMGAKRMWSCGRSDEEQSKSGRRIWVISRRSLSRRQEKMRVRGWIFGELRDGGAEGPGAGGVVGYVEQEGRSSRAEEVRGGRASGCCGCPASMAACGYFVTFWVTF